LILSLVLDGVVVAIELLGLALKVVFHVVFELLDQPQAMILIAIGMMMIIMMMTIISW